MPIPRWDIDFVPLEEAIEHCQRSGINAHDRKRVLQRICAHPGFDGWESKGIAVLAGVSQNSVGRERVRQEEKTPAWIWPESQHRLSSVHKLSDIVLERMDDRLSEVQKSLRHLDDKCVLTSEQIGNWKLLLNKLTTWFDEQEAKTEADKDRDLGIEFVDNYEDATHALQNNHFFQTRALDNSWGRQIPFSSEVPIRVTTLEAERYLVTPSIYKASNHREPSETKLTVEELRELIRLTI